MSRFTHQMTSYWQQMLSVMRNEFRTIFTDAGVVLILVLALIIYATVYSMAYGAQVLRNVPIGVVDECRTPTSRSLIETFNAGPNTYVAYNPTSMEEAKDLFFKRKIYGVVYIPSDYEEKLLGGLQANVAIYADASYFLMYRQVFQEVVTSIGATGAMVEFQRLIAKGANLPQAQATTQPVIYQSHNLFNPYLGYGTFVMPAIIMVIIQQTMLIGIGMIGGTWREFGLYRKLCPPDRKRMSTLPIVLGKALVYGMIYSVTTFYILGLHYRLFHYPMNGATGTIVVFMLAYMAACIALGIAISTLPREFAAAVVVDLDSAADAQRRLLSPRRHSRLAVQLGADIPQQPRRKRLYPHPEHGSVALRSAVRNQDALHSGPRIRRSGLHRHPLGAQPRGQGRHPGAAHLRTGKVTATPKHPQEPPRPVRKKGRPSARHTGTRTKRKQASGIITKKTSGIAPDVFFVRTALVTADRGRYPEAARPDRQVPCGGGPTARPRRNRRCSSTPSCRSGAGCR